MTDIIGIIQRDSPRGKLPSYPELVLTGVGCSKDYYTFMKYKMVYEGKTDLEGNPVSRIDSLVYRSNTTEDELIITLGETGFKIMNGGEK